MTGPESVGVAVYKVKLTQPGARVGLDGTTRADTAGGRLRSTVIPAADIPNRIFTF